MVEQHLPSCPVSQRWQGGKAGHIVYPNARTDETLLEEFGFVKKSGSYWKGELTKEQVDRLHQKLQCQSLSCDCICYNPTLSRKGNIEWNRIQTRKELAEGWSPGYKELGSAEQEAEDISKSGWGQWLLTLVGLGGTKTEPELDPTLDPNWQPEYC